MTSNIGKEKNTIHPSTPANFYPTYLFWRRVS